MSRRPNIAPPAWSERPQPPTIPLLEWATRLYPAKTPSIHTLRRWVREGNICPKPVQVGREYRLLVGAVYVNWNDPQSVQAMQDRWGSIAASGEAS